MRRFGLVMVVLAGLLAGQGSCPDPDCPDPAEGLLALDTWGGANWNMRVDEKGFINLWTFCATGMSAEPVYATDGYVKFTAEMFFEMGGPGHPGTAWIDGRVCGDTFQFTYTTDYGYTEEGVVQYEQPGKVEPCPYD